MNVTRYLALILISVLGITSCVTATQPETPEQFATRVYTHLSEGKTADFIDMLDLAGTLKEDALENSKLTALAVRLHEDINSKGGFERIEVTQKRIFDTEKRISMDLMVYFKNGESTQESMDLIQRDCGWKMI